MRTQLRIDDIPHRVLELFVLIGISVVTGCGGGGAQNSSRGPVTYSIGGTILGLSGSDLVLQNNGGNNLTLGSGATTFTFTTPVASGGAYGVTVLTQPSNPLQTCAVTNGSGTVTSVNVTSVAVSCNSGSGGFVLTGSMTNARQDQTATLLNNEMVLVAGGSDLPAPGPLASAELYNPETGIFTATGSMTTARWEQTATLLNNGQVLIAGGANGTEPLSSAELYNPATGIFTPTGSMTDFRAEQTATLLNNGQVLIAGGGNGTEPLSSAELYNPATGIFTPTGSMTSVRVLQTATLLNNGQVLIAGGENDIDGIVEASAELYDPVTGIFTPTGSMTSVRVLQTATLLNNGQVLIAGGDHSATLASAELYLPGTLTPTGLVSITVAPADPTLSVGSTQQFVATGTFSDSSMQNLQSVTWSSSNQAAGTITNDANDHGVALALAAGQSTITASAGSISGSTVLTVH